MEIPGEKGRMTRIFAVIALLFVSTTVLAGTTAVAPRTHYLTVSVDGRTIFYRESGARSLPTVILLHGFPGSSFAYRDLIPLLADRYHVVAPDLPGFGYSESPPRSEYQYTFDNLTVAIDHFTQTLGLKRYALYVCDYGATVGFRLAMAHPERITAIISQNGNAYEEGIKGTDWAPIRAAWEHPSAANRAVIRNFASPEMTKFQWVAGVPDPTLISPDTYTLASEAQSKGENMEIQADLLTNFATEQEAYPKYQEYFRKYQPPLLAVWGKNDPFFLWQAAEAFKRDLPKAQVHLYETSHFALETHAGEIAAEIRRFLARSLPPATKGDK
jgi:pimeloyl-ACP methyl ester carboxylesterase